MFQEVKIADHLLKSKEKISEAASLKELEKVWVSFPQGSSNYKKAMKQKKKSTEKGSLFVFMRTPSINQFYELGHLLGSPGQYGICKEAVCINAKSKNYKKKFAVKVINKRKYNDKKLTHNFFTELRAETHLLAQACEHPNIITYHQVFEDVGNLYIVMDHCGGGELFDRISRDQKFSEKTAANVFRQMTSALYYIHSLGIAHCDLKPENFIFETEKDKSRILLIDFGMAKIVQWRKYHKTINGTPYYIAPEVLSGKYNEACDMWSMGVILFVMVFGFPPFHCSDSKLSQPQQDQAIFKKIQSGFTPKVQSGYGSWFPKAIPVSKSCKDLISRLLRTKVADRLTSEEALEHPFLADKNDELKSSPIDKSLTASILNSLRGFSQMQKNQPKLQGQILNVLKKCNYLNNAQQKTVQDFFKAADTDGDGKITVEELFNALKQNDPDITMSDVKSIMHAVDADNDGNCSYDELLSSRIARKLQSSEDRLRKVFKLLDFDNSGTISAKELKGALDSIELDAAMSDDKCDELIKECDENGDGEIDFEEFIDLFRKF